MKDVMNSFFNLIPDDESPLLPSKLSFNDERDTFEET